MPIEHWKDDSRVKKVLALGQKSDKNSKFQVIAKKVRDYGKLDRESYDARQSALAEIEELSKAWQNDYNRNKPVVARWWAQGKYDALADLIAACTPQEWSEISKRPRASSSERASSPVRSDSSSPASARRSISPDSVINVEDKYGVWPQRKTAMNGIAIHEDEIGALKRCIDIHLHFTKNRHADSIAKYGIRPEKGGRGIGLGIGQMDDHDRENYYTLSGSNPKTTQMVAADAGPRKVILFAYPGSLGPQYRDSNYEGGARSVPSNERPTVKLESDTQLTADNPVALVLPLNDESAQHLRGFISRVTKTTLPSDEYAARLLEKSLQQEFGRFCFY